MAKKKKVEELPAKTVSKHKTIADYQAARAERCRERDALAPETRVLTAKEYAVKRSKRKGESSAKQDQNRAGNGASNSSSS